MKRFFLTTLEKDLQTLQNEEFVHAVTVLRMKEEDSFCAICGDEFDYICKITKINKHSADFEIINKTKNTANPTKNITLFQALAKGDKMELLAQKLTEIGVSTFVPVYTKNCDVKPNTHRVARLEKITQSACKQCGRSIPMTIEEVTLIKDAISRFGEYDLVLFANEREDSLRLNEVLSNNKKLNNIAFVVGPEGGWDNQEIDEIINAGAKSVSLGSRILRTETAGIYLASIIADFCEV